MRKKLLFPPTDPMVLLNTHCYNYHFFNKEDYYYCSSLSETCIVESDGHPPKAWFWFLSPKREFNLASLAKGLLMGELFDFHTRKSVRSLPALYKCIEITSVRIWHYINKIDLT